MICVCEMAWWGHRQRQWQFLCGSETGVTLALSLQDLMADLKSEISGDLARLILGLMMPPAHYDAKQLKKAMEVECSY